MTCRLSPVSRPKGMISMRQHLPRPSGRTCMHAHVPRPLGRTCMHAHVPRPLGMTCMHVHVPRPLGRTCKLALSASKAADMLELLSRPRQLVVFRVIEVAL